MGFAFEMLPETSGSFAAAAESGRTGKRITPGARTIVQPADLPIAPVTTPTPDARRDTAKMISRQKEHIHPATDHVLGGDWAITPLLTAGDNVGLEMADITIQAGYSTIGETGAASAAYYCISGEAIYRNLETQTTHYFRGGSLWTIPPRTRFRFTALFPMRLVAVAPARKEVENGADDAPYFPLLGK